MKLCPKVIYDTGSNAEKKVFDLLSGLSAYPNGVAFHSLNCSEHAYKQWAEIDFCLLLPEGIFILEIKGGRVSLIDGEWQYEGYNRRGTSREGPFQQAKSARYALDKMLFEGSKFSRTIRNKPIFGWGVVFPETSWKNFSVEMPEQVIADITKCHSITSFEAYIKSLIIYWQGKHKGQTNLLSVKEIDLIRKKIRPNVDFLPKFSMGLSSLRNQINQYTEEQFEVVDSAQQNDQLIVEGGAGTGKTYVAIQLARIDAKMGLKVLFVTESALLSDYLDHTEAEPNITFVNYNNLRTHRTSLQYDVLYVDEGQDLISFEAFELLSGSLKNGLEDGQWRWFMDHNRQSNICGFFDEAALDFLISGFKYKPVRQILKNNVRNTKEIIKYVEKNTGAFIGKPKVLDENEDPTIIKSSKEKLNKDIGKVLEQYVKNGIRLDEIGLIFTSKVPNSLKDQVKLQLGAQAHELSSITLKASFRNKILIGEVKLFKGLEKPVILAVLNSDTINQGVDNEFYVALTRANYNVTVIHLKTSV